MNSTVLHGKKAMVIGAAGGMGSSISVALAKEGITSVLVGRTNRKLLDVAKLCQQAGTRAIPIEFDISDLEGIQDMTKSAIDELGGLNYLINCAGIHARGKAYEADLSAWDSKLDTNLRATYYFVRNCLPEINKEPGGAVLKVGSITGAYSGGAMHLATTHAIEGYLKAVFEDVREFGTKVCLIRPGYVSTSMSQSERLNSDLMIQPDDVAETVLFVLRMPGTVCPTDIELRPQRSPYK